MVLLVMRHWLSGDLKVSFDMNSSNCPFVRNVANSETSSTQVVPGLGL